MLLETFTGMALKWFSEIFLDGTINSFREFSQLFEFLYWFTHQELRRVHLTPRWNPLKQIQSITAYTSALEPFKNFNKQCWKTLFQHTLHSKKPYQEWLTLIPITKMNKGKITPEIVLQEHKPVVLFSPRQYQHLHPAQGSSRTTPHVFFFWKTFAKPFQFSFSHMKCFIFIQNCDCSASLHVRRAFYFIENNF